MLSLALKTGLAWDFDPYKLNIDIFTKQKSTHTNKMAIKILLLNPNSSQVVTCACDDLVRPTLPSGVELHSLSGPSDSVPAIETFTDIAISAVATFRLAKTKLNEYDAFLVCGHCDHPLIYMLREATDKPVCGIMEASLYAARTLGTKFGIISITEQIASAQEQGVKRYGYDKFCVGVKSTGLSVKDLSELPREIVIERMCQAGASLVSLGADTLTLGCAGMAGMQDSLSTSLGSDVTIIDGYAFCVT